MAARLLASYDQAIDDWTYIANNTDGLHGFRFSYDAVFDLSYIKFRPWKEGTPGSTLTVLLYEASVGVPTGLPLTSVDILTSSITSTETPGDWLTVEIPYLNLSADTFYCIVFYPDEASWGYGNWIKAASHDLSSSGNLVYNNFDSGWARASESIIYEMWGATLTPAKPTDPSPADGATSITLDEAELGWSAG